MASNNVAITAIGIGCIAAAGAGGYFALRQSATPGASSANTVVATTPAPIETPVATAERSVQETEAVVSPATKAAKPATAKPAPAKPAKPESAGAPQPADTQPHVADERFPECVIAGGDAGARTGAGTHGDG